MDVVVSVSNVTKIYKIYERPRDRFFESLGIGTDKNRHKDFYALNDVSFEVEKGQIVGIVGRNGSGKSTILKILTGVLTPTGGSVSIKGKVAALLELGAGFNPEYSGMKNIYLNASMMHVSREEIEQKIPEILRFAEIGEYINQPVKTYSSGMFVRLAFAVAINVNPDILIVDEALAVGDARFQLKCMKKFREFIAAGKTILFVTHDINAVKNFCNRSIWLNNGKVIMDGDVNTIVDKYYDFLRSDLSIEDYLRMDREKAEIDAYDNEKKNELSEIIRNSSNIVEVVDFSVSDENGIEIKDIHHGETVFIDVSYYVNDPDIKNPVLGIAIHRMDNEFICGLNTRLDNIPISWKEGINKIRLIYSNFNLVGGEYYFDVGIFDEMALVRLDYRERIRYFFVKSRYTGEGVVILEHKWQP